MLGRTQRFHFSSFPPKCFDWIFTTDTFLGDWSKGGSNFQETAAVQTTAVARETEPMPDNSPVLVEPKIEELLDRIYQLESSSGINDTCEPEGHNGYGFGQHKTSNLCFGSDEEARNAVKAWFQEKQRQGFTLSQSVCLYHSGSPTDDCLYLQKFNQTN